MQASLAFLTGFAALVVASPVEPRGIRKSFSVPQVAAGKTLKLAPAISMLKTYAKYSSVGASAPAAVLDAVTAAQSGTVVATPESYDQAYLCPVTIGGQTLNLDFDTGSADLWVFSTLMSSSEQSGHTDYDPSTSGVLESGETWSIEYGDGSTASGTVYADTVVVGSVTATSQAVEAATSASSSFLSDTASDGLLGLAFSDLNTIRPTAKTTFFDTVKSSLALPLFTVDLKKGEPGSYDFGYIDSSKYVGDITYVDVDTSNGFWQFTAAGYAVGSGDVVTESYTAIADTGTTLLYLPSDVVTAYYNNVTGATYSSDEGGYIFPCSSTLPSWTAIIGGAEFTVPGTYLSYAQISSTYCFGGMQANTGIGFSIFGDIFLKSQFLIFYSASTPTLGFAASSSLDDVSSAFETWYLECDGQEVPS